MLSELILWDDPEPRDGWENMAVDEWLTVTAPGPVLRRYRWLQGWGSFGYFIRHEDLPETGLQWVRRWTGGGIVDHRHDVTYTLFIPRGLPLAEARGAESYREIHSAVVETLREGGLKAALSGTTASTPGGECFVRPVEFDVLNADGEKIAGAGQRRTRRGLLHQGSVLTAVPFHAAGFAARLSLKVQEMVFHPPVAELQERIASRYSTDEWTHRR